MDAPLKNNNLNTPSFCSYPLYPNYFGLKEPSFSIVPDPQYLFLSEQHREALAHLLYGVEDHAGFVLLTGEVGTGKTTICRAFLEQLPAGVEVALVLNPMQTAEELLLTLCDEFQITLPPPPHSRKNLVDHLNHYLLTAHAAGKRSLLVIDEAQNLSPQVLEHVRLLTNLETNKHKLLQIMLIGQPELRRILATSEMRQINQRITARYHLSPFTLHDTGAYIRHRLAIAGVERPLFTERAIRHIHRYSGGIPRLINILCDRALFGVYASRPGQVTPNIVAKVVAEVRDNLMVPFPRQRTAHPLLWATGLFLCSVGAGWWGYEWLAQRTVQPLVSTTPPVVPVPQPEPEVAPVVTTVSEPESAVVAAEPVVELPPLASSVLELVLPEVTAFRLLLRQWGRTFDEGAAMTPCAQVTTLGLSCTQEVGTVANLRYFDLPALLRVTRADGGRGLVVMTGVTDSEATLALETGLARLPLPLLEKEWSGTYTLVWQPPPGGALLIAAGAPGEQIRWLRRTLAQVPQLVGRAELLNDAPVFDAALTEAVKEFQRLRGLQADGVAGARTLIQLQQVAGVKAIPHLITPVVSVEAQP